MRVLLQNRNTEAVKGPDKAGVAVSREVPDSLPHLAGGLIGKGDAQDIGGKDARLVDQVRIAVGKGTRFSAAGACDHADAAFRRCYGCGLLLIQVVENISHGTVSFPFPCPYFIIRTSVRSVNPVPAERTAIGQETAFRLLPAAQGARLRQPHNFLPLPCAQKAKPGTERSVLGRPVPGQISSGSSAVFHLLKMLLSFLS